MCSEIFLDVNLPGDRLQFRPARRRSNPWRVLVLLALIFGGLWLVSLVSAGRIRRPFDPTPTPTRTVESYVNEGEGHFEDGRLEPSVAAYRLAIAADPSNVQLRVELARVMVYSSASLTTDAQRRERLQEARDVIEQAVRLNPDHSNAYAVRALTLDWLSALAPQDREELLTQASDAAVRALQLSSSNPLAQAFYAEVLADQQKWSQALDVAARAAELAPGLMDAHRAYGYVLESNGLYAQAIQEYQRALEINPSLGFIYISIGQNYRKLGDIERSLEAFDRASQLNPEDVLPYLAIGRTYYQLGEYFVAARNLEKALTLDNTNPDIYGRLGLVYFHGKNYEGALIELRCAVDGCQHDDPRADPEAEPTPQVEVPGQPLSVTSVEYYYTLSSVLAALSDPDAGVNYCPEARDLFTQLEAFAAEDPIVMGIVEENRNICNLVEAGIPFPTATPNPAAP